MKVSTCVSCSGVAGSVCFTVLHVCLSACPPETAALTPQLTGSVREIKQEVEARPGWSGSAASR